RRVACGAPEDGDGTWAEYMRTGWNRCIPLRGSVSLEQGASLLVNPLTAFALLDIAKRGGHRAAIQTAAASALGRMLINVGPGFGVTLINIVRRPEQVALLRAQGAEHVLNSQDADFDACLAELCARLNCRLAFDAVSGEITGHLLSALQRGGRVVVYGMLAEGPCQFEPRQVVFEGKSVDGFWLVYWIAKQSLFTITVI